MALFSLGLLVCGTAPSMEVLIGGRVVQGLGGGALTVGLYVVVGLVYPSVLQPAIFASFAAAWVLPALFGPGIAALVAGAVRLALGLHRHDRPGAPGADADRTGAAPDGAAPGGHHHVGVAPGLGRRRGGRRARPRAARLRQRTGRGRDGRRPAAGASRPRPAASGRHADRQPWAAGRRGDARAAECRVLLRGGLHRLRPAGPLGPLGRPGRHRTHPRRCGVGPLQPGAVTAGDPDHP